MGTYCEILNSNKHWRLEFPSSSPYEHQSQHQIISSRILSSVSASQLWMVEIKFWSVPLIVSHVAAWTLIQESLSENKWNCERANTDWTKLIQYVVSGSNIGSLLFLLLSDSQQKLTFLKLGTLPNPFKSKCGPENKKVLTDSDLLKIQFAESQICHYSLFSFSPTWWPRVELAP